MPTLSEAAEKLARRLAETRMRIVFAESCTGGLASASLAAVPGISQWHCGSAVTYRERTKIDWLGVSADDIAEKGVVSAAVARQMARGALERTSEAGMAAAITGHLGPGAPPEQDGLVFVAVATRESNRVISSRTRSHHLHAVSRRDRQDEAATLLLQHAWQCAAERQ